MKKLASITVVCTGLAMAKTGVGFGYDMGWGVAVQTHKNINLHVGNSGVAGDYLLNQSKISKVKGLSWYFGGGASLAWNGGLAARLPVGIDWDFATSWDLFAQVIPQFSVGDTVGFGLGEAIGVRYFF